MTAGAQPDTRMLGDFRVRAEAQEVARFGAAIGHSGPPAILPPTFPVVWMAGPEIRAAVARVLGRESGFVLVHTAQTFRLRAALSVDAPYVLSVSMDGPDMRGLIRLRGQIRESAQEALLVEVESELLLHRVGDAA